LKAEKAQRKAEAHERFEARVAECRADPRRQAEEESRRQVLRASLQPDEPELALLKTAETVMKKYVLSQERSSERARWSHVSGEATRQWKGNGNRCRNTEALSPAVLDGVECGESCEGRASLVRRTHRWQRLFLE
jgi:hypothetical protein